MFRFGFKKKWKSNKESKEHEQSSTNGIKMLTYRQFNNEFASRTPEPQNDVSRKLLRKPRVKRNVMEVLRQSHQNCLSQRQDSNSQEQSHFETVQQHTFSLSSESSKPTFSTEYDDKSTLIFMTEDHDNIVLRKDSEDFEVDLGTAFKERGLQVHETLPSKEQEQELDNIYGVRNVHLQVENYQTSNSDKDSIGDRETVDLDNAACELGEDQFRVHVMQHSNDAISMVSSQSSDTLLDTASVVQGEISKFRIDDCYNFDESPSDEMNQKHVDDDNYKSEIEIDTSSPLNGTNELEEKTFKVEETVENSSFGQVNVTDDERLVTKRVRKQIMFDVSDSEEKPYQRKLKPEIITTPQRKETLEDVQMKPGYSLQASALFFNTADDNNGNESETSA